MLLAIDIGGTAVKMGLVEGGVITARTEASVSFDQYQTPILTTVLKVAKDFMTAHHATVEGIGVAATGQVDDTAGVVIGTNGKIPGYEGTNFRAALEEAFSVPVRVLNDANAAALGEWAYGAGQGCQNLLMVTLGTGVGGGIVADGRLLRGCRGIAGELGHFTLYQDGVPCPCGKRGCFESYAATTALVRLAEALTGESHLNGRIIFGRAAEGDAVMLSALNRWTEDIAAGLSGLIHIFNPERVLIGGGVSSQEALLMAPLREKVAAMLMPRFRESVTIARATLGNDAGMMGAVKFWEMER